MFVTSQILTVLVAYKSLLPDALMPAVLLMGVLGTMSTRRYVIVFTVLSMLYACFHNTFYLVFIIFRV